MSAYYGNYSQYLGAQKCCSIKTQGPPGPQGPTGPAAIGRAGNTGFTGQTGPTGIQGPQGNSGGLLLYLNESEDSNPLVAGYKLLNTIPVISPNTNTTTGGNVSGQFLTGYLTDIQEILPGPVRGYIYASSPGSDSYILIEGFLYNGGVETLIFSMSTSVITSTITTLYEAQGLIDATYPVNPLTTRFGIRLTIVGSSPVTTTYQTTNAYSYISTVLTIRGPTGYTGETGSTGSTGYTGETGPQGATGVSNPNATSVAITDTNNNATYYPVFVDSSGVSKTLFIDSITTPFSVNPSTGEFRVATTVKLDASNNNIGIGSNAGLTSQGANAVAIGRSAGNTGQGGSSVAIGNQAGQITQGNQSVAIGIQAGQTTQGVATVAIGNNAGNSGQGTNAVAVGNGAGSSGQGANSVAIGYNAGQTGQLAGSIAINGSGVALNPTVTGCFISPLRDIPNGLGAGRVYYDNTTKELYWSST